MDEERFEQLYNKILDGENWDYSTLDELICLSEPGAREEGRQEMKVKAIKARIATCPYQSGDKQGICVNGIHCDECCDEIKKFIAQI